MSRRPQRSEVVTIYWRDIPAQVNGQRGRERHQILLPARFQRAIDRAKRKAGVRTAHDDVAQWRRVAVACEGDLAAAATAAAAALEQAYTTERLGQLAHVGGWAASSPDARRAAGPVGTTVDDPPPDAPDGDESAAAAPRPPAPLG
jgi:Virulence factor